MAFTTAEPTGGEGENTWFTPKSIFENIGDFDLDPCSVSFRPFDTAKEVVEFDRGQNGLLLDWSMAGRMFINPPYGKEIVPFVDKFIEERPSGVMLVFARMGAAWLQKCLNNGAYIYIKKENKLHKERWG